MKISSLTILLFALVGASSFFCSGCGSSDLPGIEENDSSYDRGRAHLRQGNEEEALDEFLSVTRRIVQSPQSHIEVGRLLMKLENNPYSLTLNELKVLRSHDRLNVKLDALKRDVLAQKAQSNSLKYRV